MCMARWHFLRHGHTLANLEGRLEGRGDSPLAPEGEREARALARLVEELAPGRILCSPLARARRTAVLAAPGWPVEVVPALVERHLGPWEGMLRQEARAAGAMEVLLDWHHQPPGGESQRQVALRVLAALCQRAHHPDTLVVAHAGVLRALLGPLDGLARQDRGRWRVPHARILSREVGPHTWLALHQTILEES